MEQLIFGIPLQEMATVWNSYVVMHVLTTGRPLCIWATIGQGLTDNIDITQQLQ